MPKDDIRDILAAVRVQRWHDVIGSVPPSVTANKHALALVDALTAVLDVLDSAEADAIDTPSRMFNGDPFPAIVDTKDLRRAITEKLEGLS